MSNQRTPPTPRCTATFWALSLVLPLAVGCQLTSADEVSRPATRGSGGSGGTDTASLNQRTENTPDADEARQDGAFPVDLALATDGGSDRAGTSDVPRVDGIGSRIDSGAAGEAGPPCDVGLARD